jgi:ABC-type nitrate/sulfonate/bicarbonate transport system substrate-binding protein
MTNKLRLSLILLLLATLACAGYFYHARQTPQYGRYQGPLEKITIGTTLAGSYSTLLWVADKKGYFHANGLEVNFVLYPAGVKALEDLLAGKVDLATCADFAFVSKIFAGGEDLRGLGSIAAFMGHEVMALKEKSIGKPEDLKGKRIGLTPKTSAEFFLGTFLTFNGLSSKDVEIIPLESPDLKDALLEGRVDAVVTWQPYSFDIKNQGGNGIIVWPGQTAQEGYWLLVTTRKVIQAKSASLERLMRALAQAEEFVAHNEAEAKALAAARYELPPDYFNQVWLESRYVLSLHQALLLALEDEARWSIKQQLTDQKAVPNYLTYLYLEPLAKAKPNSVRLLGKRNFKSE